MLLNKSTTSPQEIECLQLHDKLYNKSVTSCKKMPKIGRVLLEQMELQVPVQTGSTFGSQGHPRSLRTVSLDRRQNVLYFLPRTVRPFPDVLQLRRENEIAGKMVPMVTFCE